jgi:hypothetical protein
MLKKLTVLALLFLLFSCGKSPTDARKELAELNIPFDEMTCAAHTAKKDELAIDLFLASDIDPGCLISGAVLAKNTDLVKKALKQEFTPENQYTILALEEAIASQQDDIVELLIDRGVKSSEAFTAAAKLGKTNLIQLFLKKGVNANYDSTNANNSPALCAAAESGQKEAVKLLLDNKANPNSKYEDYSCLLYAYSKNNFEIAKILREAGAVDSYLTGQWRISFQVDRIMDSSGMVRQPIDNYYTKYANLIHDQSVITGNLVNLDSSDSCNDAKITGKVVDNSIEWVLQYTGSCCPNAKSIQKSTINYYLNSWFGNGIKIVGDAKPLSTPPQNCNMWFAKFEAVRVEQ